MFNQHTQNNFEYLKIYSIANIASIFLNIEREFFILNYILMSSSLKIVLSTAVVAVLGIGALYLKNKALQKETKPLTKQQLVRILKLIRKDKYTSYKQIATFALNISRQMRGNINSQMIEQFLAGPESPLKIKDQFEKITEKVCNQEHATVDAFNLAVQTLKDQEEVIQYVKQQDRDYQTALAGRLPTYDVNIPASLTKERFVNVQNQITKKTYLQQVAIFKKLTEYTEEELQQNPQILSEFSNHDHELEEILVEAGLGNEFEPPYAVYESANLKYRNDPSIRTKITKIQEGYQKIMARYTLKIQNKTIRPQELDQMEQQIQRFEVLNV